MAPARAKWDIIERKMRGMTHKEASSKIWDSVTHVDYQNTSDSPPVEEDRLGTGAFGVVYRTSSQGVALACKKKLRLSKKVEDEESNLKKSSHIHIITLVGTFTMHDDRFIHLLLWPVAVCDLSVFFKHMDTFSSSKTFKQVKEADPAAFTNMEKLLPGDEFTNCADVMTLARKWLYEGFGCIADAIHYLHKEQIKHQDLKPANILLHPKIGLILTDFGTSNFFASPDASELDNGRRGTPRYFAPEVADRQPAGRPQDIFSLGCVFLEMLWATCMLNKKMADLDALRSQEDSSGTTYRANLTSIRQICCSSTSEVDPSKPSAKHLFLLVHEMLCRRL